MKNIFQSALTLVKENRKAYIVINIAYYGLVLLMMGVTAFNRPLQDQLLELVGQAFMSGPLAVVGEAYANVEVLSAIGLTFVVNLLVGSFAVITLPSLVVPFSGMLMGIYRAALWGIIFSPGNPQINAVIIPHSLTLLLEGQAYILALFGVYLQGRAFLWPKSAGVENRWQGYLEGLKRTGKIYILVLLTLLIAAIYEVLEVVIMRSMMG
jgi:hypothetical protein